MHTSGMRLTGHVLLLLSLTASACGVADTSPPVGAEGAPAQPAPTVHAPVPTKFVRLDGGPPSRCNGRRDAPASEAPNCAWSSPLFAMNPMRLKEGDVLKVGPGRYRMGYGMEDAEELKRCPKVTKNCRPEPLPDNVTILGGGSVWSGLSGIGSLLNLSKSTGVVVSDLELTDDADCAYAHPEPEHRCVDDDRGEITFEGQWEYASTGIVAFDARRFVLRDVIVRGLANRCMRFARIEDALFERSAFIGCGRAGLDGDQPGSKDDVNRGLIRFVDSEISANGCIQLRDDSQSPHFVIAGKKYGACFSQGRGGYGDGLGTYATGGRWVFERVRVVRNASDGLDFLYMNRSSKKGEGNVYADLGGSLTVTDSYFRGNLGNAIKVSRAPVLIENNILLGDCLDLMAYGVKGGCRAQGNPITIGGLHYGPGHTAVVRRNTVRAHSDCLIVTPGNRGGRAEITDNLFIGDWDGRQKMNGGSERTCATFCYQCGEGWKAQFENNAWDTARLKSGDCPGRGKCTIEGMTGSDDYDNFSAALQGYGATMRPLASPAERTPRVTN